MKKHLFSLGLYVLTATLGFAQQHRQVTLNPSPTQAHAKKTLEGIVEDSQARPTVTLTSCASINDPLPFGWTPSLYTYGPMVNGYFNGVNVMGDFEKAMIFNTSSK